MENDLISRQKLIVRLAHHHAHSYGNAVSAYGVAIEEVQNAPSVEAEPVRHGRWTWITEDIYRCENCGERVHVKEVMGKPNWDYCPSCGAKMDAKEDDHD